MFCSMAAVQVYAQMARVASEKRKAGTFSPADADAMDRAEVAVRGIMDDERAAYEDAGLIRVYPPAVKT